eukprot:1819086-Ditylum_brightwellii.AAC.1
MSGDNNDVKPDLLSYNSCIHAYAKSCERGVAIKAERLIQHMEDVYKDGGEKEAAYQAETILNKYYNNSDAGMDKLYRNGMEEVKPGEKMV